MILGCADQGFVAISAKALDAAISGTTLADPKACGGTSVTREQRKLAATLAAQFVGYSLTVKGISPSLVSMSVIVLTCQYN